MKKKFDIVIIGSGLGGLLCGAILSQKGYSVCILEKHYQIGGNLQTFKRKGKEFDTGMHYFGCMEKGQVLHKIFSYLGIADQMQLKRMDMDGFDHMRIGDKEFKYAQGFDAFQRTLENDFPDDTKAIQTYVRKLKAIWDANNLLNLKEVSTDDLSRFDIYSEKIWDFVEGLTDNKELKAVLTANNGLYAGNPDKTPLYVHAVINNFFIRSAWRLDGGGSNFAKLLKDRIESNGGQVITRKEVTGFEYEGKKITTILTKDGDRFTGERIISNIHPAETVDLVEDGKLRRAFKERIKSLENSIAPFTLYIIFKPESFRYFNHNIYYHDTMDVWGTKACDNNSKPSGGMMYTTEDKEHPGYAETMTAITYMKYDEVREWENTQIGKRGDTYENFKKGKAEQFINMLSKTFPDIRQHIDSYFTSSPLTYRDYTGTVEGSMYGIVKDANDPLKTFVSNSTRIPNLYLTGQNIIIHGMLGTTMSALLTCAYFTNINELIKEIREVY